jgi:hypothetical protein
LETVKDLADIVTEQVELLSRPIPTEDWPLFRDYDRSKFELATEMKSVISELSSQVSELNDEPAARFIDVADRMNEEYDITRREAMELLEVLDQNDALAHKGNFVGLA